MVNVDVAFVDIGGDVSVEFSIVIPRQRLMTNLYFASSEKRALAEGAAKSCGSVTVRRRIKLRVSGSGVSCIVTVYWRSAVSSVFGVVDEDGNAECGSSASS